VTNLSTISKVLERLALARLKPHIRASPNYCILQSAYRQGHSTETAISNIWDNIIGSIDSGHVVALVSLDISPAFDSVTHDVLVQRLEDEFGVTDTSGRWISDYLTGRSFTVRVGQSTSPSRPMTTAVPRSTRFRSGASIIHYICKSNRPFDC